MAKPDLEKAVLELMRMARLQVKYRGHRCGYGETKGCKGCNECHMCESTVKAITAVQRALGRRK